MLRSTRTWLVICGLSLLLVTNGQLLCAQLYGQKKPPAPPKPDAKLNETDMTFLGVQNTPQGVILQVEYEKNNWLLQVDPKAKITITGTAEPDFMVNATGLLAVRYKAEVNLRQKQITAPVTEFEFLNLSDTIQAGVVEDSLGGAFVEPPPMAKGPVPMTKNFQITGPVASFKNGVLMVGGIKTPVDPNAKVSVNFNSPIGLAVVPPQTVMKVNIEYFSMLPGRGILKVADVKIAEPLTVPKKNPPRTATPNKAAPKEAAPKESAVEKE